MNKKKSRLFWLSISIILFSSFFGSYVNIICQKINDNEEIILETHSSRLGVDDFNSYLKFKNSTGVYEKVNGTIRELESFVEPEWKTEYREYIEKLRAEEQNKANKNNLERIIQTAFSPFLCFFGFINPLSSYFDVYMSRTISAKTHEIKKSNRNLLESTEHDPEMDNKIFTDSNTQTCKDYINNENRAEKHSNSYLTTFPVLEFENKTSTFNPPKFSARGTFAAPNNPTLHQGPPSNYMPSGCNVTVITDHTDSDGATDIDTMWLWLEGEYGWSETDIIFYCSQDSSSGSVTITDGSGNLIETPAYSHTTSGVTNGYRVTWNFILDWDIPYQNNYESWNIYARTVDDSGGNSGWKGLSGGDVHSMPHVIINSITYTVGAWPNGLEEGYGDTLDEGEDNIWLKGGSTVVVSGVLSYYFASTLHPYPDAVDVELIADGSGTGFEDDKLGPNGEFNIIFTIPSSTDLDYNFSISLNDWAGSGDNGDWIEDHTTANHTRRTRIDADDPTITSFLHSDSNTELGYNPQDSYDDDTTADYVLFGATDFIGGSGLSSSPYRYEWNDGGFGIWTTDTDPTFSVFDGESSHADVQVADKAGNIAEFSGEDIVIDVNDPSGFTITLNRASGFGNGYYAYNGTFLYFNSGEDGFITVIINNDGDSSNSGYYTCRIDDNSVFESASWNSTSLPVIENLYYQGDSSGVLVFRIVNCAGNYQEITIETVEDITEPTTSFFSITENTPHTHIYNPTGTKTIYFSDGMGSTDQLFTVNVTADDTGGAGVWGVLMGTWGGDGDLLDINPPYSRQYSVTSSETTGTIEFYAYDYVGNIDTSNVVTVSMIEDTTAPNISQHPNQTNESSPFLYYDRLSQFGYYSDNMDSPYEFFVGGSCNDAGSGVRVIIDNTTFGDDPSCQLLSNCWAFIYHIDENDITYGEFNITYTIIDNVNNSAITWFYFYPYTPVAISQIDFNIQINPYDFLTIDCQVEGNYSGYENVTVTVAYSLISSAMLDKEINFTFQTTKYSVNITGLNTECTIWFQISVENNATSGYYKSPIYSTTVYDSENPEVNLTSITNGSVLSPSNELVFICIDYSLTEVSYQWDNTQSQSLESPWHILIPNFNEGHYNLKLSARDSNGHWTNKSYLFYINQLPVISLNYPINNSIFNPKYCPDLSFNISDISELSTIWYQWDDESTVTISDPYFVPITGIRNRTLVIFAEDQYGASSTAQYHFYILQPNNNTIEIIEIPDQIFEQDDFTISIKLTNYESIPLSFLLIVSSNDTIISSNSTRITLQSGESRTINIIIKPPHASPHETSFSLWLGEELYHIFVFNYEVKSFLENPKIFYPLLVIFIIIVFLFVVLSFVSKKAVKYIRTSSSNWKRFLSHTPSLTFKQKKEIILLQLIFNIGLPGEIDESLREIYLKNFFKEIDTFIENRLSRKIIHGKETEEDIRLIYKLFNQQKTLKDLEKMELISVLDDYRISTKDIADFFLHSWLVFRGLEKRDLFRQIFQRLTGINTTP